MAFSSREAVTGLHRDSLAGWRGHAAQAVPVVVVLVVAVLVVAVLVVALG
jgi:hypothetical protein